jgi:hypothetical protein
MMGLGGGLKDMASNVSENNYVPFATIFGFESS